MRNPLSTTIRPDHDEELETTELWDRFDVVPPAEEPTAETDVPAPPAEDDVWPTGGPPKGVRVRVPTLVLTGLIVTALGFAGGAQSYKSQHPDAAVATSAAPAATGRFTGAAPNGAAPAAGAATPAGNRTTGTVSTVDGSTIYVTTAAGNLVKVTVPDGTTISVTRTGASAADVRPGDAVVITGSTATDGSTQASSIAVNPQNAGGARQAGGQTPVAAPGG
jgi:hypothetical protein